MRAAFARFDANRSGKLDHRELRAALHQLGLDVGEGEATVILQRHDANNNGLLDVREFGSLVRQLGRRGTVDLVTHAAGAVWQTAQSDDGRQYFFNDVTGESTWRRPTALDAKPRPAARATPRRTADEPPLSPATVPRASRTRLAPPQPLSCTRAAHACHALHATRPMPRAPGAARHVYRAPRTPTHNTLTQMLNCPLQVLLAVNSVSEVGRQRALAVSGLDMDLEGTHSASRSGGGRSGGSRGSGRSVDP